MAKASTAHQEIEKKDDLEKKVKKESFSLPRFVFNTAVGTGVIYAANHFFGLDGLSVAGSFPVGTFLSDPNGFTSSKFRDESIFGALWVPLSYYSIGAIKQVPKYFGLDDIVTNVMGYSVPLASSAVAGGLTFGILAPVLTAIYYPMEYIIREKKFSGSLKYTREKFYKGLKETMPVNLFVGAAVAATYALPFLAPYLFPAMAVANILYKMLLSRKKQPEHIKEAAPNLHPAPAH